MALLMRAKEDVKRFFRDQAAMDSLLLQLSDDQMSKEIKAHLFEQDAVLEAIIVFVEIL